jgi:hypothetical protein
MFSHAKVNVTRTENGVIEGELAKGEYKGAYGSGEGALSIYAPSVEQYLQFILDKYPTPQNSGSSDDRSDRDFHHFNSFKEAQEVFVKRPWETVTFNPLDIDLLTPEQAGNEVAWDVTGDYIDIGTFLSGEPEHFGHNVMGNPRGLFATIHVDLLMVWSVRPETLQRQSVRVQALADWLESQQIRTQIIGYALNSNFYTEVVVKDFQDPLNINNLAVATHTDFFRRMIFRQAEYSKTWSSGYGSAISTIVPPMNGITVHVPNNPESVAGVDKMFDKFQVDLTNAIAEGLHEIKITKDS